MHYVSIGLLIRLPPMTVLLQCGLPLWGAGNSACSGLSDLSLPQVNHLPHERAEVTKEWLA